VPLDALREVVGFLLVVFGLKWMRKAILRYAGLTTLHDEANKYEEQVAALHARRASLQETDPFGVATAFKSVLLEGLKVAFIVITFGVQANDGQHGTAGVQPNGILIAALGAVAAGILVVTAGAIAHAPKRRVRENALKYTVGLMLATFGTFWGGAVLGIHWWHEDLFLPVLAALYLLYTRALVLWLLPTHLRTQEASHSHNPAGARPVCRRGRAAGGEGGAPVNAALEAVKATYTFFAGDRFILACVVAAFVLASVLVGQTNVPNAVIASIFFARIAGGLAMSRGREVVGRGHS